MIIYYNVDGDIHPFEESTLDGNCIYCAKSLMQHGEPLNMPIDKPNRPHLDRGEVVNLAHNILHYGVTPTYTGIKALCKGIMVMDQHILDLYDQIDKAHKTLNGDVPDWKWPTSDDKWLESVEHVKKEVDQYTDLDVQSLVERSTRQDKRL